MEFVAYNAQDPRPRQELLDDAFAANKGMAAASLDHYKWKFRQTPFTPASYEYAVTEESRMIGYYAAIPYRYRVGEREVVAGLVCDVMTHSQARRKGVFTSLSRFAIRELQSADVAFLTGYPVTSKVIDGHLKAGWLVAFELPTYVKLLRADTTLRSRHLTWLTPVANGGIAAYHAVRSRRVPSGYDVEVGPPRELLELPAFRTFVDRWSSSVRNHLVKSADFYSWRLAAPGTEYQAFLVHRGDAVVAGAIGRSSHLRGIPSYVLLDVMSLQRRSDALSPLYRRVDQEGRRRGAEILATMMSRHSAREYCLTRFGFIRSPYVFKLILRPLDVRVIPEQIFGEQDWHLMWIDSDDM